MWCVLLLASLACGALVMALERQQRADQAIGVAAAALSQAAQQAWRYADALDTGGESRAAALGALRRAAVQLSRAWSEIERPLVQRRDAWPPGWLPAAVSASIGSSLGAAAGDTLRAAAGLMQPLTALTALTAPPERPSAMPIGAASTIAARADALLAAARALRASLDDAAQHRAAIVRATFAGFAGLALVLLAALGATAVEPLVRASRRQAREIERQALHLERLALVGENTTDAVILSDAQQRVQWVNPAFTHASGWSAAEVEGALSIDLIEHPLADGATRAALREAMADGRAHRCELRCRRRNGSEIWLDLQLRPLRDDAGALRGFVTIAVDVSRQVAERRKLAVLWSALPTGVIVVSAGGEVVDANRAAERMLDAPGGTLLGVSLYAPARPLLDDEGRPYEQAEHPALRTLRSGWPLCNETMGVTLADGSLRWLLVNTEPQLDERGRALAAVMCFADITERRQLQEQLRVSARADPLTGLPNRVVVMARLERALAHARAHAGYGFAVLFMDFDRFKQVNDTLGHGSGDELLRQIGERLRVALRPGDAVARVDSGNDLAARLGGDEFVVVLDGVRDPQAAAAIAERLLEEMAQPYTVFDHPVQSSASIGIVVVADGAAQAADAHALLRDADTAMYEAKRGGRGRWVLFERSMHERLLRTMALEHDLRRALRGDELFVAYQPVVDLASGRVSGVEALARWRHPERGLVPPLEFVPLAEECGLIDDLGRLVLATACRQFVAWQRTLGVHAPRLLAVNLSRAQLDNAALADEVSQLLRQAGMAAQQLQLEVTESLAAQDERAQAALRELKSRGVRLALDDFGTGYSSLACLHQLPIDTVKVDRSFVSHAETVEYHRVLIEATVRVAHTLGMTTVAEGIETEGQAALMAALDCEHGQGWLYGRPMSADELERWLAPATAADGD